MRVHPTVLRPAIYRLVAPDGSDDGSRANGSERTSRWITGLTVKCQSRWGQAPLFSSDQPKNPERRYRVWDGATWGAPTSALALAAAQARAVAIAGTKALVWADDGTSATVASTPGGGFIVESDPRVGWAAQCRALLDRHG